MKNRLLLVLAAVALLSAGWLHVSGLTALVGLVPLLLISEGYDSSRRSFWRMAGWTALAIGLWAAATTWWVWKATPIGPIAIVIVQNVLFGGVFMLYHYVSKRAKRSVANSILVCGWIAAEFIFLNGQISFPWLQLGNAFANDIWAVQWYEWTGVFGGTLWVLVANLVIFQAIRTRRSGWWIGSAASVVGPLLISGAILLTLNVPETGTVKVTVVQPNIDPYFEKFFIPQAEQNSDMLMLMAQAPEDVDMILLPETAMDDNIWEGYYDHSRSVRDFSRFMFDSYPGAQLIAGATTYKEYPDEAQASGTARYRNGMWYDAYNSALIIDGGGIDVYHKKKLVIGAEMMPFRELFRPLERYILDLGGISGQYGSDDIYTIVDHHKRGGQQVRTAVVICYESVYGEFFTRFVRDGAQAMFVITNDGWWGDTPGYAQHFDFSRLRAVETRRAIARSANTGISGFISPTGKVLEILDWDTAGTLTAEVPLSNRMTFYARWGDYIARAAVFTFLLGLVYFAAYRIRRRNYLQD